MNDKYYRLNVLPLGKKARLRALTSDGSLRSLKWTVLAAVIPTLCGFIVCALVASLPRWLSLV